MPDAFFVPKKTRKRKRNTTTKTSTTNSKSAINGKGRPGSTSSGKVKAKDRDEELESGGSDEDGFEGIDDMELRASSDSDPNASGEEDELETPAEKRLRLAKLYLDSVKEDLGSCFMLLNYYA